MASSLLQKPVKRRETLLLIIIFTTIASVSLWTFKDSFKLALTGDDWLLIYTIRQVFDVRKSLTFLNPQAHLCTYCPPYSYLSAIKYFWGYNPFYYYVVNFISRLLASFGIFFVTKKITKKYSAAIFAALFFSITYIGIQTTDWVFNINHYLGIATLSFFVLFYWNSLVKLNFKNFTTSIFWFISSLIVSPPRMHGIFPFVVLIEIVFWLTNKKKRSFSKSVFRLLLIFIFYRLLFVIAQGGYGSTDYILGVVTKGVEMAQGLIVEGNYMFLLNPIATIGNYVLPDSLLNIIPFENISLFGKPPFTFFSYIFVIGIVFMIISTIILYLVRSKFKHLFNFNIASSFWLLFVRFITKTYPTHSTNELVPYLVVGGLTIIFTIWLFHSLLINKRRHLAAALLIGFMWMIVFSLFPWVIAPYSVLSTSLRYSIQQAAGLSIWLGVVFTVMINGSTRLKKEKLLLVPFTAGLISSFVFMHIAFSKEYLANLTAHRSEEINSRLWNKIFTEVPEIDNQNTPSVFYLSYDNYYDAEWNLRFVFPSRAAIYYDVTNQNINPFMTLDYDDLVSIVTDGEALLRQGMKKRTNTSRSRLCV